MADDFFRTMLARCVSEQLKGAGFEGVEGEGLHSSENISESKGDGEKELDGSPTASFTLSPLSLLVESIVILLLRIGMEARACSDLAGRCLINEVDAINGLNLVYSSPTLLKDLQQYALTLQASSPLPQVSQIFEEGGIECISNEPDVVALPNLDHAAPPPLPSHIPPFFPPLPHPHTYLRTLLPSGHTPTYLEWRAKFAQENDSLQESLIRVFMNEKPSSMCVTFPIPKFLLLANSNVGSLMNKVYTGPPKHSFETPFIGSNGAKHEVNMEDLEENPFMQDVTQDYEPQSWPYSVLYPPSSS